MNDTICAIATLVGESSINVIRISGDKSIEIVNSIFDRDLTKKESHTISYGHIVDNDERIDEVLVSVFKSPKTFTTEDVVEINSHGGKICVNKILELLLNKGCRLAEPGEFLKRALLNGRIDLVEAEAVSDMINSKTDSARKMSMRGINKELSKKIDDLRDNIMSLVANIEVNIDYPEYEDELVITKEIVEEKIKYVKDKINELLDNSKNGVIIKNGINISIVGKPNVGKSSILNKLLGEDKAIVTSVKGTTRDIVEGSTIINGIEVNFFDTAGIRKTDEIVESIGIEKSIKKMEESDLVLFVISSSEKIDDEDMEILEKLKEKKILVIYNKVDLSNSKDERLKDYDYIEMSTKDDKYVKQLKDKIVEIFKLNDIEKSDYTYISNSRQISLLNNCLNIIDDINKKIKSDIPIDLIEIDIKLLLDKLGEITGNTYENELIDKIFSNFCLGK